MIIFYDLGIRIYYLLVLVASTFKPKAKLWLSGRRNCINKIQQQIDNQSEYAWFHASSLGEFEQGRPVIEALKEEYPEIKIILTFFSPSGYEVRKNYDKADIISYLPLDTRRNAKRFIEIVNPKWTFFVKYEYWHHFLNQTKKSGSELYLVSGIFREEQLFFKGYGGWYREMLKWFAHLFVQTEQSAALLKSVGIENVTVAGDSRFDRVKQIAGQSKKIEIAEEFVKESNVLVCGSTWEPDENILTEYLKKGPENVKLIIAPHEIKKEKIENLVNNLPVKSVLFSQAEKNNLAGARVLIIDNIGMLSSLYKYGQISYIGGGFGTGIHNTLEAAVYGVPVLFGPNYTRFQEAVSLIERGGGKSISGVNELEKILNNYFTNQDLLSQDGKSARDYVDSMTGATTTIMEHLRNNH